MRTDRITRGAVVGALVALVLPLLPLSTASAADEPENEWYRLSQAHGADPGRAPGKAAGVTRRDVDLSAADRVSGFPTRAEPYLRLKRASFTLYLDEGRFYAEAYVQGEPPLGESPTAFFDVGILRDNTCKVTVPGAFDTFAGDYTNASEDFPDPAWADADCAVVTVHEPDEGEITDAFVARLRDVTPKLEVKAPTLLGSKKLNLVKGVWTKVEVPVANGGDIDADQVVVKGSGKGLKVKAAKIAFGVSSESTSSATIQVKVVGKTSTSKLKLTATGSGGAPTARGSATVRTVKAPPRPRSGGYADPSGDVRFSVRKGKVQDFRIYTQTTCGGYPDSPTTSFNTYDFPTAKIARNGIVDRVQEKKLYTVTLRLKIAGGKVTRGYFSYGGPNRCRASESFNAKHR